MRWEINLRQNCSRKDEKTKIERIKDNRSIRNSKTMHEMKICHGFFFRSFQSKNSIWISLKVDNRNSFMQRFHLSQFWLNSLALIVYCFVANSHFRFFNFRVLSEIEFLLKNVCFQAIELSRFHFVRFARLPFQLTQKHWTIKSNRKSIFIAKHVKVNCIDF